MICNQQSRNRTGRLRPYFDIVRCVMCETMDAMETVDNVQRLDGSGRPSTEVVLLQHTHSQRYVAIRNNRVHCIPLQDDDRSFYLTLDIYPGQEMSPESRYYEHKVNVLAIHQSQTSSFRSVYSAPRQDLYLCSFDDDRFVEQFIRCPCAVCKFCQVTQVLSSSTRFQPTTMVAFVWNRRRGEEALCASTTGH